MRSIQAFALRSNPGRVSLSALALALSVAVVAVAPSEAYAGGTNNGKGNGAGSSTGTSSGNNGNDKGVGNASGSNGNSGSNGSGKDNAGGNGGSSSGGSGSSGSNGSGSSGSGGGVTIVTLPTCALSDISGGAATCSGYFQGNLLSNSAGDLSAQAEGLKLIGLADWDGTLAESQLDLSSQTIDFTTLLNGFTFIGVHYGAGVSSPSPQTPGGVTAFYRFDAGTNLNAILLTPGSASAARLYSTGPAPILPTLPDTGVGSGDGIVDQVSGAVPEPATWALMIGGFGLAGALLRRRRALMAAA